jgi:serine phosphatase RsbU (regulator of sigma subunit)
MTRTLAFSNAGLPFPLHASATTCQLLGEGGLPSGLLPTASYNQHIVQLSPGDSVLFATDGLHEALNPEGIEFCSDRLPELWPNANPSPPPNPSNTSTPAFRVFLMVPTTTSPP